MPRGIARVARLAVAMAAARSGEDGASVARRLAGVGRLDPDDPNWIRMGWPELRAFAEANGRLEARGH